MHLWVVWEIATGGVGRSVNWDDMLELSVILQSMQIPQIYANDREVIAFTGSKTVAHFFCTLECNYRRLNTKWIYCIFIFIQNKKIITRIIFLFNVAWQNFVGNNLKKTSLQDSCINNFNCSGWSFTYSGNIRKWFFYVGKSVSFTRVICSVFSLFQSLPVCIYSVQFQEPDRGKSAQKVNENAWRKPEIIIYYAWFFFIIYARLMS